ncbi:AlbA family DNA-binding domain-containing protein [Haloterrigena alkaliphila]|uniref:ATP-binding protein n=1 Tax=Haloterrigena alkaliphila TaxID=2816475 RepID=A0A8A2VI02_9EURY|nr:ATP-binding protein [Haloterrigena alkaliphila]QSW99962.1 ATP-binding protein [Haloterrigena alkaliphila]
MPDYNPFGKPLSEVGPEDLYSMKIPEGYYFEYKRDFIDQKAVAKAISSFANTYGGLFFIGIEENEETNKPGDWFTLTSGDPQSYNEKIRSSVKENISPSPMYETHSFKGTNSSGDEGYVILVDVPESTQTPHINNDGRVYRRTGEGSDPYKVTSSPEVLDDLYRRRDEWQTRIDDFCNLDVGLTVGQSGEGQNQGWPFLELYAIPSTLDDPVCANVISELDRFQEIFESSEIHLLPDDSEIVQEGGRVRFGFTADSYRATSEGVVAQLWTAEDHQGNIDTAHTPLTFTFLVDGGLKIFLPIPTLSPPENPTLVWRSIDQAIHSQFDHIEFLDGLRLLGYIHTLLNSYLNLLSEYEWPTESGTINLRARFRNTYRTLLVFETDWYIDLIERYGAPVCYDEILDLPRLESMNYELDIDESNKFGSITVGTMNLFQAFGLPIDQSNNVFGEFSSYVIDQMFQETEFED